MTELNDESFKTEIEGKEGIAVVDFWAPWCGPCRALAPHVEALAAAYEGKARFYKLDIDEAGDTAAELGVMSIPVVIFFKDGQPVQKSVGLKSKDQLAKILDGVIG